MSDIIFDIFNKILINYFDKSQISELKEIIKRSSQSNLKAGKSTALPDKDRFDKKYLNDAKLIPNIDLLITFANEKLDSAKLIEFLLVIGETCIAQGQLDVACKIYENILSSIKNVKALENIAAHSLLALGEIYSRQALWEKSIENINRAKRLFNRQKDLRGLAKCNNLLGTIYGDRGNIKKAQICFENSLTFLDPKNDVALIGMVETNLGILENIQGNQDEAHAFYQRALVKYNQLKDSRRICQLRYNMGMLQTQKGNFENALADFDASSVIAIKAGYLPDLALSYLSKAFVYAQLNDFPLALAFADKSMDICYRINDRLSIADLYKIKGIVERKLKHYDLAKNYFFTSLRINVELENPLNQAESLYEMGILNLEMNLKEEAIDNLQQSLAYFKKMKAGYMVENVKNLLSQIS